MTSPERAALWSPRTVAWYERANDASDYADRVLATAAPAIDGCRSALDVGAGFGALAVPLARRLERVTAIEPSPAMAAALQRRVRAERLDNVEVIERAWEEPCAVPHDLVLCAHVGPLIRHGSPFLATAGSLARRAVVLVRDAPGAGDKFFFSELYPALLGRRYERRCAAPSTAELLDGLGVSWTEAIIAYRSDQPFETLEEACDFWTTYMGLEDALSRDYLRGFLAERLQRHGEQWVAPLCKRASVISWMV